MASARREDRLRELQRDHVIEIFPADATDPTHMTRLAEETKRRLGPIDILVYATGTNTPDRHITRLTPPVWRDLLSTNLDGAY